MGISNIISFVRNLLTENPSIAGKVVKIIQGPVKTASVVDEEMTVTFLRRSFLTNILK